ncbi:MAG TPA: 2-dehydropantoate 2-reductase [Chloroflexota bacterium]|nr:2-dehydropantoate 2-reductase [Chloroflexota bacterium]
MRIAVVGAGAVGCMLGARLAEHGHQVTLIGRTDQVEAIHAHGLHIEDARGSRRYQIPALCALESCPDLVLLTVKTQDVVAACRALLPLAQDVPVLVMQNGLQADRLAAEVLGRPNVIGAVLMCAATYLASGSISVQFPGWAIVGEPFGPPRARTAAVARVLRDALPTYPTRHLTRVRWSKLIANLNNALCAATGLSAGEIGRSPAGRLASLRGMREGYRVIRAAGIALDHGLYGLSPRAIRSHPDVALIAVLQAGMTPMLATLPERAALAVLAAASRSRLQRLPLRFSTYQSIARGKPTEIEYLNGEIVRLGARLNMPTPYNTHFVSLVRQVEQAGAFFPVESLLPDGARAVRAMSGALP